MTMDAGNAACTSGLSKRIYDARIAVAAAIGITTDPTGHGPLKADCYAIASAIVAELTDNAEAVISIATGALQTSTAVGSPTAPPAPVEQTLRIR